MLIDDETRSYWDHITGECVHGPLVGASLPNWPIEMTTVEAALNAEPELRVHVSKPSLVGHLMNWLDPWMQGRFPPGFRFTMGEKDPRLPEMELGLGVVEDAARRFYRLPDIRHGIEDKLAGRLLKIVIGADEIPTATRDDGTRPLQLFTRWYGFALTYPGCEIFDANTPAEPAVTMTDTNDRSAPV